MSTIEDYSAFEIPDVAHFERTVEGLVVLRIRTQLSSAELYLQGAHLARFQAMGEAPLLFVSKRSAFLPGKAIRGGVPICFPWFGPRAGDSRAPSHGFARTSVWEVKSLRGSAEAGVNLTLELRSSEDTRAAWPHDFIARLEVQLGRSLEMKFEVENTGGASFSYEEALHTYLAVSDVRAAEVTGLEGASYLDKTASMQRRELGSEPFRCTGETDRIFPQNTAACVLRDPGLARRVRVEKSGSQSTVVWNPWIEKAAAMADFADDEWPEMLCIESANVAEDTVTLRPGERHALTVRISSEA